MTQDVVGTPDLCSIQQLPKSAFRGAQVWKNAHTYKLARRGRSMQYYRKGLESVSSSVTRWNKQHSRTIVQEYLPQVKQAIRILARMLQQERVEGIIIRTAERSLASARARQAKEQLATKERTALGVKLGFSDQGKQDYASFMSKNGMVSINHKANLMDFHDAVKKQNARDDDIGKFPHYQRGSGAAIICRNYDDLKSIVGTDYIRMSCVTFKPDSSILGGVRERKKKRNVAKKRSKKKRPLAKGQQLGLRNPIDMTKYPPKIMDFWRYEQIIETDGTGSFSVYCNLRDPQKAINGSGTYERARDFANLYDEYKPIEMIAVLDFLQLNVNNGVTRIAVDYDSIPTGTYLPSDLRDNEYMREFSGTNQMAYVSKIVPLSEGTFAGRPSIIHQRGWYDFNSPPEEGALIIAGERYVPGNRMFNLTLTVKVLLRRRRTIAIARDQRLARDKELQDLEKKLKRISL